MFFFINYIYNNLVNFQSFLLIKANKNLFKNLI